MYAVYTKCENRCDCADVQRSEILNQLIIISDAATTAGDIIEGRTNSRRTNKKKFGVTEEQESCSPPCTPMTVQPH